jgi:hypothetical protein
MESDATDKPVPREINALLSEEPGALKEDMLGRVDQRVQDR